MEAPIDWLLEGESWIRYRTYLDLLGKSEKDPQVVSARKAMLEDSKINNLLVELSSWPGTTVSNHKNAGQQYHKLTFLADLGLKPGDQGLNIIIDRVMERQSVEGPFQLTMNIPTHFGGSGEDTEAWALCDAPLIVYALAKIGLNNEPLVMRAAEYLIGLIRDNG